MSDLKADKPIRLQDPVSAVLTRSPAVVAIFMRHRMACPGCAMAPYMTIAEAAQTYGLDPTTFVRELAAGVGESEG
jgi:hybrid cluster-associated redox disulfide protein